MATSTLPYDRFSKLMKQAENLSGPNEDPRIVALAAHHALHYRRAVEREDLIRARKDARNMEKYRPKEWKEFTDIVCDGKMMTTYASGDA